MKKGLSIPQTCHLFEYFLGIRSLDFPELWHADRNTCKVVCDRARVLGKTFLLLKLGKWAKIGVFEFKEKFGH